MTPRDFLDDLEAGYETELSRLGSSKAIYALTSGEMDASAVFIALATRSRIAADAFGGWADTEDSPDPAALFDTVSQHERDRASDLFEQTDTSPPDPVENRVSDYFEDLTSTIDRTAALIAWLIISDRTYSQTIGFFVGSANRDAADRFRTYRDETTDHLERALSIIETQCSTADDWDQAEKTAGDVIDGAYDTYATTLEDMGINVKPIC